MNRMSLNLVGVLAAGLAFFVSFDAVAGIVGSRHDLSGDTSNTDQVCVFCHTPHGSDTTAPVPLWNKVLPAGGSFQMYADLNSATFDSIQSADLGSVSLACMSCHDGTQAMDTVLNSPGSGGYNAAGAEIDALAIGTMTGTPVPVLGTDLRDDHPVSMQYGGGGCSAPTGTTTATACGTLGDADFVTPSSGTANNTPIWWIDGPTGTGGARDAADIILYNRLDLVAGNIEASVECGSCHDPHNGTAVGGQVAFMRFDNSASAVCTACHVK